MKNLKKLLLGIVALALVGCNSNVVSSSVNPISEGASESTGTTSNGNDDTSTESSVVKTHGITWSGIDDISLQMGDYFNLLDGVHAVDGIDGELVVKVEEDDFFSYDFESSYTIVYSATNSVGTKSTKERNIVVIRGVTVQNGSFSNGTAGWRLDVPGGNGTFKVVNEEAVITVKDAGTEAWSIQLYQSGITFQGGKTYELSFDAKSAYGRSLSAGFEDIANNYAMMVDGYQGMTLTNTYQSFSILCTPSAEVFNVKVVIYLGRNLDVDSEASATNPIDCTIDNIKVREKIVASSEKVPQFANAGSVTVSTGGQFEELPPVTAIDYKGVDITSSIVRVGEVPNAVSYQTRMLLSYRVVDSEGNFGYINRRVQFIIAKDNPYNLINPDFDNGYQGWMKDVNQTNGSGAAQFTTEPGIAIVDISNGSSDRWHIQLYQTSVQLTKDLTYRATITIKANSARTFALEISNPANGFAVIATKTFNITEEYQTLTFEYTPTINVAAKFSLLLGGQGASIVSIDYINNTLVA
jgi:hypothetical protein